MGWQPYYDEDGNYVNNDPNIHTAHYSCSNDHRWVASTQYGETTIKELEPLPPKENGKVGLFDRIAFPNGEPGEVMRSEGNGKLIWQALVPQ